MVTKAEKTKVEMDIFPIRLSSKAGLSQTCPAHLGKSPVPSLWPPFTGNTFQSQLGAHLVVYQGQYLVEQGRLSCRSKAPPHLHDGGWKLQSPHTGGHWLFHSEVGRTAIAPSLYCWALHSQRDVWLLFCCELLTLEHTTQSTNSNSRHCFTSLL